VGMLLDALLRGGQTGQPLAAVWLLDYLGHWTAAVAGVGMVSMTTPIVIIALY
jgi:hypothetical protein